MRRTPPLDLGSQSEGFVGRQHLPILNHHVQSPLLRVVSQHTLSLHADVSRNVFAARQSFEHFSCLAQRSGSFMRSGHGYFLIEVMPHKKRNYSAPLSP